MKPAVKAGILGAADGVTSISGIITAGGASGTHHTALAVTAIGGALAATVSMAGAEMLSEDQTNWSSVGTMGAGTLIGAGLPAIPLLAVGGRVGWLAVALLSIVLAVGVGEVRHRMTTKARGPAIAGTVTVLALGAAVGLAVGLAG